MLASMVYLVLFSPAAWYAVVAVAAFFAYAAWYVLSKPSRAPPE